MPNAHLMATGWSPLHRLEHLVVPCRLRGLRRTAAATPLLPAGTRPEPLYADVALTAADTIAYTQVGVHTNEILLGLSLVVRGAGLGAVTNAILAAAYLGIAPEEIPHASTVTRISQQIGGAFGTAILAMILTTQLHTHRAGGLAGQASAFGTAFWWSLGFTVIALVPALLLPARAKTPATADS
jgi:hypothetical protein